LEVERRRAEKRGRTGDVGGERERERDRRSLRRDGKEKKRRKRQKII